MKWTFSLPVQQKNGLPGTGPVVSAAGMIAVALNDTVFKIAPDGTLAFQLEVPPLGSVEKDVISGFPAFAPDGTLYVGTGSGRLIALGPDNEMQWVFNAIGALTSPALTADGTIYVSSDDVEFGGDETGYLYALRADGTLKWQVEIPGGVGPESAPAVSDDGRVYVIATSPSALLAFDRDGKSIWASSQALLNPTTPVAALDGSIYTSGVDSGGLSATDPDGSVRWSRTSGTDGSVACAIGVDGTIYVSDWDAGLLAWALFAWTPTETKKWEAVSPSVGPDPALGANGNVYAGDIAVDAAGNVLWTTKYGFEASAIGPDGTLYGLDGAMLLYALGP